MADVKFVHYGVQKEGVFPPGEQEDGTFIGVGPTSREAAYDCYSRISRRKLDYNGMTELDKLLLAQETMVEADMEGYKCYFRLVLPK